MEICSLLQPLVVPMVLGSKEILLGLFLQDKCRLEIKYFLPERRRGLTKRLSMLGLLLCFPL